MNPHKQFINRLKCAACLLLMSSFSGCGINESMDPVIINPVQIGKGYLEGAGSEGIPRQNIVISDTTSWNELKNKMDSINNVTGSFTETEINFRDFQIIAAFSELRPMGGYEIEIKKIEEHSENIEVTIENIISTIGVAQEIQPFHIVKIPKTNKQILFN